ncbi:hypothetical protein [Paraburkholderia caribensis]|uniref:hypothetical protein n=1 Tax=Paraburkholderia caribensis TaxID=75105 RepID=UPI00078B6AF2|nr:hypothetical protein [Paraburkholderia caribensis]AMV46641.1 hypothetical protein ATN79_32345 [Paraburkholderia caribensis]
MNRIIERRVCAQSGQALVEFLVATMLAASVLLLAVVMLGKFNDIRNHTLMGSRYAAWERTVWIDSEAGGSTNRDWYARNGSDALQLHKSDQEIQRELLARVVAGNGAPIAGTDRSADPGTGGQGVAQPAMWKDPGGAALLDDARDVSISTGETGMPTQLDAYTSNGFGSMPTASGAPFAATLDLPSRALQTASLRIATGMHSDALRRLWPDFGGFAIDDTNALLTNAWLPEGAARAKALFAQAVPAAHAPLIAPSLYRGLRVYAPEIDTFESGRIRDEVVPADRLAR